MRARLSRRSGLTLIELAVAAGMFAVAAIVFLATMQGGVQLDQLNRERFWAREECRRQLENIYAMDFANVPSMDNVQFDVGFDVNGVAGAEKLLKAPGSATKVGLIRVYGYQNAPVDSDANCYRVVITATWKSGMHKDSTGAWIDELVKVELVGNVSYH